MRGALPNAPEVVAERREVTRRWRERKRAGALESTARTREAAQGQREALDNGQQARRPRPNEKPRARPRAVARLSGRLASEPAGRFRPPVRAVRKKPNNRPQTRLTSPNRRQPGPNAVDRLRPSFVLAHSLANCYLKAGER
jgi:hypothetical protein